MWRIINPITGVIKTILQSIVEFPVLFLVLALFLFLMTFNFSLTIYFLYFGLLIISFIKPLRGFTVLGITAVCFWIAVLYYKSAKAQEMSEFLTLQGIGWWILAIMIWIVPIAGIWAKKSLPVVVGIASSAVYFIGYFWYASEVFCKLPKDYSSTIGSFFHIACLLGGGIGIFVFPILTGWGVKKLTSRED